MSEPKVATKKAQSDAERDAKEKVLFAKFLAGASALIADPNGSSRVRLGHTLAELGAKQNNIAFAGTYAEAISAIETRKPRIILCEFNLGKYSGLDLLQEQRRQHPDSRESVFALITGNTSQSAVAAAAEEDVDTFIIKPYTLESLKRTLTKAAIARLHPSDYIKTVEAGKEHLFKGEIELAVKLFTDAMKMDPKPALACFYKGQAESVKEALESATKDYKTGLTFNKIHYKCLIGLYELMMQKKEYVEAYNVVKKVAQYFPANPKRLASVLRLAIMTSNYEDIEGYYRIFTMLEARNDELVRYICSALIVTGKYYFINSYNSRALDLLEKAAVSAAGKTSFLRHIIEVFMEFGKFEEAKGVLRRFPAETQKSAEFLAMEYLVTYRMVATGVAIQKGRDLIKQGVESPIIYEILIESSAKAALADSAAELEQTASKKWPANAPRFKQVLDEHTVPLE